MKMYLNESQTAKLVELGFEKPKSSVECELPKGDWRIGAVGIRKAYSIGELIEMLGVHLSSIYYIKIGFWVVNAEGFEYRNDELIDALYDMVVKLKEEGVI